MNKTFLVVGLSCYWVSVPLLAQSNCATELCVRAENIKALPADVADFVARRDACDYFRSEPWPETQAPWDVERRQFLQAQIQQTCVGSDQQRADLRQRYREQPQIIDLLDAYEVSIERP